MLTRIFKKGGQAPLLESEQSPLGVFLEVIQVLAISLALIIPIRFFLIQPFYVQGASMEPNFFDHEYLIVDELSYRMGEPKRGDVVVFKYPNNPKEYFIKRIIGLPGETVEIKDGKVFIFNTQHPNGIELKEQDYLDQDFTSNSQTVTMKANEFYLLGDNRSSSLDSRFFGAVDQSYIVGRVWLRGFPFDRWKHFTSYSYEIDQTQP